MHPRDIFDITGVYPMKGGGVYFFGGGQFVLRSFSHFETHDFKNNFSLRRPHFQYLHFQN